MVEKSPIKPFPRAENIHAVANPFLDFPDLITANVYIVGKGPVTLIDTGPKLQGSLNFTREQMQRAGFDIGDIERIIITHGHLDHFGLAVSLREAAKYPIDCFVHAEDKWRVISEDYGREIWQEMARFLVAADMPPKEIEKVRGRFSSFRRLCDPLDEVSTVEDGDEFIGDGYRLRVIHTPGHTVGSCCIYESEQKVLFSGDNILKHITPNPLMEMRRDRLRDPNYQSLKAYMTSLDKLARVDARFVFPGHGEYIEDLIGIIRSYRLHHRERMDLIWKALKRKSRPLYHIVDEVFPFVPEGDITLALSEIFVHLEILINEGRAELADPGPPALYRAL